LNFRQEAFSRAYVHAVASAAGFKYTDGPLPDDDGVDVTVTASGVMGITRSPRLDIQLKCKLGRPDGDPIRYPLRVSDYEGLRHVDYSTPRILVVVFVPDEVDLWTSHTEEGLLLSYCGYWVSLHGAAETLSTTSVTVALPRANTFSVAGLLSIMARIGERMPL
jgi:hypothetical protein